MPLRLLALLIACFALLAPAASAAEVPEGYAYQDAWFEAQDGVQLHAGVFLPADRKPGEKHPTIMVIGPYTAPNNGVTGATAGGPNAEGVPVRFPELFTDAKILKDRWAYVQVDARGFGGSGGCFEYYGPNEMKDTGTSVDWAASQDWSTGKVATWGKSYDGADSLLAVAARPKGLAAAVIQAPGLSAYTALWQNGVHYGTGRYGTTPLYTVDDLVPGQNLSTATSPEYGMAAADAFLQNPTCRVDSIALMNTEGDRSSDFWKDREPYKLAAGATTPVLWTHGFFDANTKPVFLDVWNALKGEKRAWFGQFTHLRGHENGVGRRGFLEEAMRFLDRNVRGVDRGQADPVVTIQEGNGKGRWRSEEQWPPADAESWKLPLRGGEYTNGPGNTGDGPDAGNGLWTLTKPLPHAAHLAGEAVVEAQVFSNVPDANVVAHLYDVDEKGQARLVNRGATKATKTEFNDVRFSLYPQDWVFEKGHRVGVVLSGTDDDWYTPGATNTPVGVVEGKASMTLPLLRFRRDDSIAGGISESIAEARPFAVPAAALSGAVVDAPFPAAQVPFPEPPLPPRTTSMPIGQCDCGIAAPAAQQQRNGTGARARAAAKRATLKLRIVRKNGKRVLVASGRAPGARRVTLAVKFGRGAFAKRTARVRRGAYTATFSLARLQSGRLTVAARLNGRGRAMTAGIRLK